MIQYLAEDVPKHVTQQYALEKVAIAMLAVGHTTCGWPELLLVLRKHLSQFSKYMQQEPQKDGGEICQPRLSADTTTLPSWEFNWAKPNTRG